MRNISDPEEVSADYLRQGIQNYHEYMLPKKGSGKRVFITATISRDEILQLLSIDEGNSDGIRIYLTKESSDDTQDDVKLLVVPVRSWSKEQFVDRLDDGQKFHFADCRDPYCPQSFENEEPNLLPPNFFV